MKAEGFESIWSMCVFVTSHNLIYMQSMMFASYHASTKLMPSSCTCWESYIHSIRQLFPVARYAIKVESREVSLP